MTSTSNSVLIISAQGGCIMDVGREPECRLLRACTSRTWESLLQCSLHLTTNGDVSRYTLAFPCRGGKSKTTAAVEKNEKRTEILPYKCYQHEVSLLQGPQLQAAVSFRQPPQRPMAQNKLVFFIIRRNSSSLTCSTWHEARQLLPPSQLRGQFRGVFTAAFPQLSKVAACELLNLLQHDTKSFGGSLAVAIAVGFVNHLLELLVATDESGRALAG